MAKRMTYKRAIALQMQRYARFGDWRVTRSKFINKSVVFKRDGGWSVGYCTHAESGIVYNAHLNRWVTRQVFYWVRCGGKMFITLRVYTHVD